MSPRKLSDGDRQEILSLYRNTNETTSTLAVRFGVSSSTVSRFLKNSLTETEYEDLIQEKRLARTAKNPEEEMEEKIIDHSSKDSKENDNDIDEYSSVIKEDQEKAQLNLDFEEENENLSLSSETQELEPISLHQDNTSVTPKIQLKEEDTRANNVTLDVQPEETEINEEEEEVLESVQVLAAMYGEDMEDEIEDIEEDEEDFEDEEIEKKLIVSNPMAESHLQVLPLENATFPKVCYLVIDRYAELVTKPLKDFGHLGKIPGSEILQLTLPIFDNHKVAKRFCDRKGKVIKVPDGKMLQKTSIYLKAKGISRILIDGKIYSLN
ncbi:helix-turn-helix domain-containing protein [Cyanobacterium aponinum]|uniref:helix-turn-helix domain-containing protein n=1 Tax=Cyanobacterium aponinum TaxID=379064 RepID=UPI000C12B8F0|nr:helix-turn-helix domain-containing protein [Cyanobacterium aponinum]PHV61406.1 transposase [Cyanobacterium aponinum IPPAS B-1201]